MALKYSTTHRTNRMSQLNTDIGVNAVIKLFNGTRAASVATAPSGTVLATFAGNASGFGTAASGALTASAIASVTATGAGTATWFRIYKSDGTTAVVDGDVTMTGGGGDMTLDNTNIASGQVVSIANGAFVLTAAGA